MRTLTILGEILPIVGTVGLLGLWIFQQTKVETRSGELKKLAAARAVYQTYQSHNAVFNALVAGAKNKAEVVAEIRKFQTYNYELGLAALEASLPSADKAAIPEAPNAYSFGVATEETLAITQKRLELLQQKISEREEAIGAEARSQKSRALIAYVVLSLIMIGGSICKILDKLHPPT